MLGEYAIRSWDKNYEPYLDFVSTKPSLISPNGESVVSPNEIRNTRTGGVINLIDTSIPNHCHPWLSYDGRIIAFIDGR